MISVLFLIPTLDRGGAENVLVDLVNHMDQSKFRITVQTLFDQNSQKDRLRDGIRYKSFLYHQFHGNSRLLARIPAGLLYRMIVRERYDIVVSYLEGPTTHILSGCPYPESKKAAWVHVEMKSRRQMSVGFCSHAAAARAYRAFDRIVFVAKTVQASFEEMSGERFPNACVLYNTIDSRMILEKGSREIAQPFPSGEFRIVSVGRVIPAKGFDRLARIQRRLREEGYPTHVYILGTGQELGELKKSAEEYGIADSFSLLGFQENPYQYVSQADLFVCASRREGFSTAVSEALVLGVPVVSTRCSGACELLGDADQYGLVTDNDEDALYHGVKRMLDDPELLAYYRGQAKIRGIHFSSERTAKAVEDALLSLCKEK